MRNFMQSDSIRGAYSFEVESKVKLMGESMQDLKDFVDALSSLTQEQVYNYVKGKKLLDIYSYKSASIEKIIDEHKKQPQKNWKTLEQKINHLEQYSAKRLKNLEKNAECESKELYSIFKNVNVLADNLDLESPKEDDMYIQLELLFEMEVDYTWDPYVPATLEEPAEGGYPEVEDYDAWNETDEKISKLLKILNMDSLFDFDIVDCEYPDEDKVCENIQEIIGNDDYDDYC